MSFPQLSAIDLAHLKRQSLMSVQYAKFWRHLFFIILCKSIIITSSLANWFLAHSLNFIPCIRRKVIYFTQIKMIRNKCKDEFSAFEASDRSCLPEKAKPDISAICTILTKFILFIFLQNLKWQTLLHILIMFHAL